MITKPAPTLTNNQYTTLTSFPSTPELANASTIHSHQLKPFQFPESEGTTLDLWPGVRCLLLKPSLKNSLIVDLPDEMVTILLPLNPQPGDTYYVSDKDGGFQIALNEESDSSITCCVNEFELGKIVSTEGNKNATVKIYFNSISNTWIVEQAPLVRKTYVNLTYATEDYDLSSNQYGIIYFSDATEVDLHIGSVSDMYEIIITSQLINGINENDDVKLFPNGSQDYVIENSFAEEDTHRLNYFRITRGIPNLARFTLSTAFCRSLIGDVNYTDENNEMKHASINAVWKNTEPFTEWTSLGKIEFPVPQTGKIIIKKIH